MIHIDTLYINIIIIIIIMYFFYKWFVLSEIQLLKSQQILVVIILFLCIVYNKLCTYLKLCKLIKKVVSEWRFMRKKFKRIKLLYQINKDTRVLVFMHML